MKKFDIITFGSATQDIYLIVKDLISIRGEKFITGEGICLNPGSKTEIKDAFFFSGGGGTNTATTFAKQGFKVSYCGMVGDDFAGDAVLKEIKKLGVDTSFVKKTKTKSTNTSVFLVSPNKDRTLLVYRGASDLYRKEDIPWGKIRNAKWFYLAPFSGKLAEMTEGIINFAKKNNIRVALNPGYSQLNFPKDKLKRILSKVDVLILNKEEASKLSGIPYQKEKEIFRKIDEYVSGIVIMTKGIKGAVVSDGKHLYRAPSLKFKGGDATGAGDAFGSGFVSGLIEKNDIEYAIQLAMANSGYSIAEWGAKEGLLKKDQKWKKVKVKRESCQLGNLCLPK